MEAPRQIDAFPPETLLSEARQQVMARREGRGTTCPCCGQGVRLYKRCFTSGMARALIWLYRQGGDARFVHVPHDAPRFVLESGGYFALMKKWGLIDEPANEEATKRKSGCWRVTALGVEFVEARRAIPLRVHVYSNAVVGWSEELVTITAALDKRFDYAQLMGREGVPVPQMALTRKS